MSENSPLLTLAIPTFNRSKDLRRAIETALQEIRDAPDVSVELLVVDNASTDDTQATAAAQGAAVRYVRNSENVGLARNLEKAAGLSTGRYTWLMGDDEVLEPGALRQVVTEIQRDGLALYVCNYSSEPDPPGTGLLRQTCRKPISTSATQLMDFVRRSGWLWTLGNLNMVLSRTEPLQAADWTPHLNHPFAQAGVYLEAFHDQDMRFIDRPLFRTFVKSQTTNKDRWSVDGTLATMTRAVESLDWLTQQGILPERLPFDFFNGCTANVHPMWIYALEPFLQELTSGGGDLNSPILKDARKLISRIEEPALRKVCDLQLRHVVDACVVARYATLAAKQSLALAETSPLLRRLGP